MFFIEVRLLAGRYAAAAFNDRTRGEWPMHPARVFSALVAAWAGDGSNDSGERAALLWLESQPPPRIVCSDSDSVSVRQVVTHYVPGNDAKVVIDSIHALGPELSEIHWSLVEAMDHPSKARAIQRRQERVRKAAVERSTKAGAIKSVSGQVAEDCLELLPENRNRQARFYPVIRPDDEVIRFEWRDSEPTDEVADALDSLVARVGRIGHSSTLVACRCGTGVEAAEPRASPRGAFVPTAGRRGVAEGTAVRVMAPELLEELEAAYAQHQGSEPRALPAVFATYASETKETLPLPRARSAGEWIILPVTRKTPLRITRAIEATRALRAAIMTHAPQPIADVISGHGDVTAADHAMFLALPNVGSVHSDGFVGALAIALPDGVGQADREAAYLGVAAFSASGGRLFWRDGRVFLDPARVEGVFGVASVGREARTAQRGFWSRPSAEWVSVTPVALDRFPHALRSATSAARLPLDDEIALTLSRSCESVGLPSPEEVALVVGAPAAGVPGVGRSLGASKGAARFPLYRAGGSRQLRHCVHVRVRFAQAIRGPVVLGAGRHFGYGLMLPVGLGASGGSR